MEDVAQQEAGTEQNDAGFEPELIGGDAGLEDAGNTDGVGDEQADDDGPQDIFDVGEGYMVRLGVAGDGLFNEFSGIANGS